MTIDINDPKLTAYALNELDHAGRTEVEVLLKTLDLEQTFVRTRFYLGLAYQQVGMFTEAVAELQESLRLSGGNTVCQAAVGHALARWGKKNEAISVLRELEARGQEQYVPSFNMALVCLGLGDHDLAFAWLAQALEERSSWLVSLRVEPLFDAIRNDRRFNELVGRVGLPQS